MDTSRDTDSFTVDNCDKEPIQTPGTVQPFGLLLAGPADLSQIQYASANAEEYIGLDVKRLLGSPFSDILGSQIVHDLRNLLTASTARSQRERLGRFTVRDRRMEIYGHRNADGLAVIELETGEEYQDGSSEQPIDNMRKILSAAGQRERIIDMMNVSVVGIQALTGYDRVMAYRFTENGDGEIVAEAHSPRAESFLGHRYPAWDIPTQARALQVKNPFRMLSDVYQTPVPILSHGDDLPSLDIAMAHVRGISPIHVEYLQNMGVHATMSIALVVDGRLWGMFACHNLAPKIVRSDKRIALELYAQMMSLLIKQKLDMDATSARGRAANARERVLAETDAETDLLHSFQKLAPILSSVIVCDGMAVLRDDKVLTHGHTPSMDAIRQIAALRKTEEDVIALTDNLGQSGWVDGTDLSEIGGAMLVRATAAYPLQLMFFREEQTRHVKWAGKPEKTYGEGKYGQRITPRGSFDAYMEQQKGYAESWSDADMAAARELQIMLTQITAKGERIQMMRHKDLVTHQRQQDLMIAELNHRVKNTLALIRSLSRQAKASSASLESYALSLEQRISALAAAHDLAVSNTMQGVSLRALLQTELSPYIGQDNAQVLLSGPMVGLRADVAPMIALVIHEIVTNAAKYGALSVSDGIVRSKWTRDESGIHFDWQEMGGPTVTEPSRNGFGRSLVEKAIPYELDGTSQIDFTPSGVRFKFSLPDDVIVDIESETQVTIVGQVGHIPKVASGRTALLVEDNMVLAMDMMESLTRLGTEIVETAGTVDDALQEIAQKTFDFAVLDMNLRGIVTFDIAKKLRSLGVPFIFVTGYGSRVDMPTNLRDIPILTKPVDEATLSRTIDELLN